MYMLLACAAWLKPVGCAGFPALAAAMALLLAERHHPPLGCSFAVQLQDSPGMCCAYAMLGLSVPFFIGSSFAALPRTPWALDGCGSGAGDDLAWGSEATVLRQAGCNGLANLRHLFTLPMWGLTHRPTSRERGRFVVRCLYLRISHTTGRYSGVCNRVGHWPVPGAGFGGGARAGMVILACG